jgi:hypothetical protein
MISTEHTGYWATGITLRYRDYLGNHPESWAGSVDFYDGGLPDDYSATGEVATEGVLRTRYYVDSYDGDTAIAAVIDTLIADAGRLGIRFENPALSYEGDGEDGDYPPPEGWRRILRMQADRIGWDSYRVDAEAS